MTSPNIPNTIYGIDRIATFLEEYRIEKARASISSYVVESNKNPRICTAVRWREERERLKVEREKRRKIERERQAQERIAIEMEEDRRRRAETAKESKTAYNGRGKSMNPERAKAIWIARQEGQTLREIGERWKISPAMAGVIAKQETYRQKRKRRLLLWNMPKPLTRPIDMGGTRGEWITFTPESLGIGSKG